MYPQHLPLEDRVCVRVKTQEMGAGRGKGTQLGGIQGTVMEGTGGDHAVTYDPKQNPTCCVLPPGPVEVASAGQTDLLARSGQAQPAASPASFWTEWGPQEESSVKRQGRWCLKKEGHRHSTCHQKAGLSFTISHHLMVHIPPLLGDSGL